MSIALSPAALVAARETAGLTRQDAAQQLGCSMSGLQQWERGWREPGALWLAKLADLYGVAMESLFVHDGDAATPHDAHGERNRARPGHSPVTAGTGSSSQGA